MTRPRSGAGVVPAEPAGCHVCADLRTRHEHALRLLMVLRQRVRVAITPKVRADFATWRLGYTALKLRDTLHRAVAHG